MAFLKIIRPGNLLIIGLLLYLVRYALIAPVLASANLAPYLNEIDYFSLVMSIIFIAAASYVVNDIYDVEMDKINKPEKWFVGNSIPSAQAINFYYLLNIAGALLAIYVSYKVGSVKLASLQLLSIAVNWWYAKSLKKTMLIGNLAVSISSAFIILMPIIFEPIIFFNQEKNLEDGVQLILVVTIALACFAFLVSMIREIIKDMEDVEGDKTQNCKTLPIVAGIKTAAFVTQFFILVLMVALGWIQYRLWFLTIAHQYIHQLVLMLAAFVQLPLLVIFLFLFKQNSLSKNNFKLMSGLVKLVMIAGILSLCFFKLWYENN